MEVIPLTGFFFATSRALGLFAILPLGWDIVGATQRITISLALGAFFAPIVHSSAQITLGNFIFEIIVGGLIGLPAALVVEGAGTVGELFDTGRGQTIAQSYDPLQQGAIPITGILGKQASWCVMLHGGITLNLIQALAQSFILSPPAKFGANSLISTGSAVLSYIAMVLESAILWSIPFLVVFLGVEVLLGFFAKALNLGPLSSEAFLVKTITGSFLIGWLLDLGLGSTLLRAASPVQALF